MVRFVDFNSIRPEQCGDIIYAHLCWVFYIARKKGTKDIVIWLLKHGCTNVL